MRSQPVRAAWRILLVEDNPGDARLVREAFADAHHEVQVELEHRDRLSHGIEACTEATRAGRPFSLVLLDLGLPEACGLQTFQRFREQVTDVPVLVLTGNRDFQLATEAVRRGAEDYLDKGSALFGLVSAVRNAIGRWELKSELERSHRRLERINRVLQAVRAVSHAMLRETNRQTLMQVACERLATLGRYKAAWAIFAHAEGSAPENGKLTVACSEGSDAADAIARQLVENPSCPVDLPFAGNVLAMPPLREIAVQAPGATVGKGPGSIVVRLHCSAGRGVLGVLLHSTELHGEERTLLRGLATDLGMALETIASNEACRRAEAETRRSLTRAEGLFQSARAVVDRPSFDAVASTILEQAQRASSAPICYLALLGNKADEASEACALLTYDANQRRVVRSVTREPFLGVCERALRKKTALFENAVCAGQVGPSPVAIHRVLVAPLTIEGESTGILVLANSDKPFAAGDVAPIRALAELAAVALRDAQTRDALHDSREKLRLMAEHVGIGLTLVDRDCKVREFNRQMHSWFPTIAQSQTHCHAAFLADDPAGCDRCPTRATLQHGTVNQRIVRLRLGDSMRTFELKSAPIRDRQGVLTGALETLEDVTERDRAEREKLRHIEALQLLDRIDRALRRSTARESMMDHALREACEALDCERLWLLQPTVNRLSLTLAHHAAYDGVAAPTVSEVEVTPTLARTIAASIRCGGPIALESVDTDWRALGPRPSWLVALRPQSGTPPWVLILGGDRKPSHERDLVLLREIGNRIQGALALMLTFDKLRQSEERFRTIFHAVQEGIFLADAHNDRILLANQTLQDELAAGACLVGWTLSEVLGQEQTASLRDALIANPQRPTRRHDIEIETRTGRPLHVDVSVRKVALDERELLLGCVRDVTELREIRATLAQSDRMASVGLLAAGVAHEINNPLTYTLYNLATLKDDLPELTERIILLLTELGPERAAPFIAKGSCLSAEGLDTLVAQVQDAYHGADRVRQIVSDLRTFSRVDSDRCVPVDVCDVLDGALNMAQNELKYRARLRKDYQRVPYLLVNDGKLAQVFLNLIVNAIQAIEEGAIDQNEIIVRTLSEPGAVVVQIADTGSGIDPRHLRRLFEPFFTTKEVGKGSGLGLSICKNIIDGIGGSIDVESELGHGTTFSVRLPLSRAKQRVRIDTAPVVSRQPMPRRRILVVDDEERIGRAIASALSSEHDAVVVGSGRDALDLLARESWNYDAIVSDLLMPELSGMDLHREVEAQSPALADKMLFVTGGAFTPKASAFLARVGNPRLEKPFEPKELREQVRAMVTP